MFSSKPKLNLETCPSIEYIAKGIAYPTGASWSAKRTPAQKIIKAKKSVEEALETWCQLKIDYNKKVEAKTKANKKAISDLEVRLTQAQEKKDESSVSKIQLEISKIKEASEKLDRECTIIEENYRNGINNFKYVDDDLEKQLKIERQKIEDSAASPEKSSKSLLSKASITKTSERSVDAGESKRNPSLDVPSVDAMRISFDKPHEGESKVGKVAGEIVDISSPLVSATPEHTMQPTSIGHSGEESVAVKLDDKLAEKHGEESVLTSEGALVYLDATSVTPVTEINHPIDYDSGKGADLKPVVELTDAKTDGTTDPKRIIKDLLSSDGHTAHPETPHKKSFLKRIGEELERVEGKIVDEAKLIVGGAAHFVEEVEEVIGMKPHSSTLSKEEKTDDGSGILVVLKDEVTTVTTEITSDVMIIAKDAIEVPLEMIEGVVKVSDSLASGVKKEAEEIATDVLAIPSDMIEGVVKVSDSLASEVKKDVEEIEESVIKVPSELVDDGKAAVEVVASFIEKDAGLEQTNTAVITPEEKVDVALKTGVDESGDEGSEIDLSIGKVVEDALTTGLETLKLGAGLLEGTAETVELAAKGLDQGARATEFVAEVGVKVTERFDGLFSPKGTAGNIARGIGGTVESSLEVTEVVSEVIRGTAKIVGFTAEGIVETMKVVEVGAGLGLEAIREVDTLVGSANAQVTRLENQFFSFSKDHFSSIVYHVPFVHRFGIKDPQTISDGETGTSTNHELPKTVHHHISGHIDQAATLMLLNEHFGHYLPSKILTYTSEIVLGVFVSRIGGDLGVQNSNLAMIRAGLFIAKDIVLDSSRDLSKLTHSFVSEKYHDELDLIVGVGLDAAISTVSPFSKLTFTLSSINSITNYLDQKFPQTNSASSTISNVSTIVGATLSAVGLVVNMIAGGVISLASPITIVTFALSCAGSVANYVWNISLSNVITVLPTAVGLGLATDVLVRNIDVFFKQNTYYEKVSVALTAMYFYELGSKSILSIYNFESKVVDIVKHEFKHLLGMTEDEIATDHPEL